MQEMTLSIAQYSLDESKRNVSSRTIRRMSISDFKFVDKSGKSYIIYHTDVDGVFYIRAVDVWRSLTMETGHFYPKYITCTGEMKRILIGKSRGCPSTRPVYVLTIEQALEVCRTFADERRLKNAHPLEKWIREKVVPAAKAAASRPVVKAVPKPAWTPDDIPTVAAAPIPAKVRVKAEPQPPEPQRATPPTNLTDYAIWLRYPGQKPREVAGEKWMLPAVHWNGQVLWKERIGIDINDVRSIVKIRDEDAEALKDCLWAKNGGPKCLVDKFAWQRIKALPSAKSDPVAIAALDAFFAEPRCQGQPDSVQPEPVKAQASAHPAPAVSTKASLPPAIPSSSNAIAAECGKFEFIFNGRHVCNIYATKDEDGCVWVGTKGLEPVFGPYEIWPQSIKNANRRTTHWNGGLLTAMSETTISELAQVMTPSEKSSGAAFVIWLRDVVKPTPKPAKAAPLQTRIASFFFKGVTHEIHVAADASGEIWASIPELESFLDLKACNWPDKARLSRKNIIEYNGVIVPAVSEEYLEDIAVSAPPSKRDRAKAFCSWWTKDVWDMFSSTPAVTNAAGGNAGTAPAAVANGSIIEQARNVGQLMLKLANENEALLAENTRLKAEMAKLEKSKALISKQKEAIQAALKALDS